MSESTAPLVAAPSPRVSPAGPSPRVSPAEAGQLRASWPGRIHRRIGTAGMVSSLFFVAMVVVAILAPVIAPYGPNTEDLSNAWSGPSLSHLLGTDELGRDLLSRLIWGARPSLLGPLIVIAIATGIAVPLAAIGGWKGGTIDLAISRVLDLLFAFPGLLLAILVVALYGPGLLPCSVALALAFTPWIARVVRSGIVRERAKPYIAAAEVQGLSGFAICVRHLIPNVASTIWSQATISFGYALVALAGLSFLGLNIQPPQSDWGVMTNNENALLQGHPAEVLYPSVLIVLVVSAVTYVGNRLSSDQTGRPV
jgi:peptide/nickel transport system permease protein